MQTIKCVVVGDAAVGKTSLLMSYTTGRFPADHVPTIFDNHAVSLVFNGEPITLGLYDTAGQAYYDRLRVLSYPQTDIFIVCYCVASPESFRHVKEKWVPEIRHHCPKTPFLLVGTKVDLREDKVTLETLAENKQKPLRPEEGQKLAKTIKAVKYMESSAMTEKGLKALFTEAITIALQPPPQRRISCNFL